MAEPRIHVTPSATTIVIRSAEVVRLRMWRSSTISAGWARKASRIAHAIGIRNGANTW